MNHKLLGSRIQSAALVQSFPAYFQQQDHKLHIPKQHCLLTLQFETSVVCACFEVASCSPLATDPAPAFAVSSSPPVAMRGGRGVGGGGGGGGGGGEGDMLGDEEE